MTPFKNKDNAKSIMVEVVGSAINKILKKNQEIDLTKEDNRIDIAMAVCDEVIRVVETGLKK
tara:strand:+ start:47 stop:232 length:186 start_codon:yes stop_codon:yes gene_type:complete